MTTPLLSIAELAANQSQPEVTVNEAIRILELARSRALSRTTTAEPGSPSESDVYIIPASATGTDWATFSEHDVAYYLGGAWYAITPTHGYMLFVTDEDALYVFDGTAWASLAALP